MVPPFSCELRWRGARGVNHRTPPRLCWAGVRERARVRVCRGVRCRAVWGWGSCGQGLEPFGLMGKLRPRKSLLWNGISLTGKVGSVPMACSILGAEAFLCSSEGFEVGIREFLSGFKGCAHLRALSRGPVGSQHAGRA